MNNKKFMSNLSTIKKNEDKDTTNILTQTELQELNKTKKVGAKKENSKRESGNLGKNKENNFPVDMKQNMQKESEKKNKKGEEKGKKKNIKNKENKKGKEENNKKEVNNKIKEKERNEEIKNKKDNNNKNKNFKEDEINSEENEIKKEKEKEKEERIKKEDQTKKEIKIDNNNKKKSERQPLTEINNDQEFEYMDNNDNIVNKFDNDRNLESETNFKQPIRKLDKESKTKKRKYDDYIDDRKESKGLKGFRKGAKGERIPHTESEYIKDSYQKMLDSRREFNAVEEDSGNQYFGEKNRYPKRNRFPRLNKLAGEIASYRFVKNHALGCLVPQLSGVLRTTSSTIRASNPFVPKTTKRKLKKGLKEVQEENEYKEEDSQLIQEEMNFKEEELPEDYIEEDNEDDEIIKIYPMSQKGICKNLQVHLNCEVIESKGNNKIIIGNEVMKNIKRGNSFTIPPNVDFNFFNFSKEDFLGIKISVAD